MIERTVLRGPGARPRGVWPGWGGLLEDATVRQSFQIALLILGIATLTFVLYLYILPTSQMSEARARIAVLRAEKASLSREGAELAREISYFSDLTLLEHRARELGMGPPARAIFLDPSRAAHAETKPAAPAQGARPDSTASGMGLDLRARVQWDAWYQSAVEWVHLTMEHVRVWWQQTVGDLVR